MLWLFVVVVVVVVVVGGGGGGVGVGVVAVVLTLAPVIKSAVTGQAPVILEWKIIPGKKNDTNHKLYTYIS